MSAKRRRIHATLVWLERVNRIMRKHPWPFDGRVRINLTDDAWKYIYRTP